MKEQFVPYELALKLRALGFDEECINFWYPSGTMNNSVPIYGFQNWYKTNGYLNAPLWQQAFDWFRKNHQLEFILNNCSDKDHNLYDVVIYDTFKKKKHEDYVIRNRSKFYTTYEEARLECLKKLIEINIKQ